MTLKVIENQRTDWGGLWYNAGNHSYSSEAINLAELRKFKGTVRIYMKKNRYYDKELNRPNYVFTIASVKSDRFTDLSVVDDDYGHYLYVSDETLGEGVDLDDEYVRLEDAIDVAQGLIDDCAFGYSTDDLCVEARSFMEGKSVTVRELLDIDE